MNRGLTITSLSILAVAVLFALAMMALQPSSTIAAPVTTPAYGTQPVTAANLTVGTGPNISSNPTQSGKLSDQFTDGALEIVSRDGERNQFCPLKHTNVKAEISGFISRVTVTQEFVNPAQEKIEAVYTFPLPQNAAVDDMTLHVGDRVVRGVIKKREEARKIYQDARNAGHVAALLDQERPNIFTQSVANIAPGATVKVEITYIETLRYEAGVYEFVYPMVVGPRYIPGAATGQQGGGWSPDTTQVPDASRITPPVAGVHYGTRGTRAGHDISLEVNLDAGVSMQEMRSPTHDVDVTRSNAHSASIRLHNANEIPNKDFVLKYDVAGGKVEDALLAHARDQGGKDRNGFFTFLLQPPDRVRDEDATPRELIFVLDTSGSMSGYPIETAKKTMKKAIETLRPGDTFNLITFAGDTYVLFPQPVLATTANLQQALQFLEGRRGGGGTEMMKAIRAALGDDESPKPWEDRVAGPANGAIRVVCFMTDGYVGNDMAIIAEVQKHPEARVFSFGIGSSVNRFLLDKMAEAGRGEVEYVLQEKDAEPAAARFYERVHTPVLTDISIDWNGLPVSDVIPGGRIPDLFSAKPLAITGRYHGAASGVIRLRGKQAGRPFERQIKVTLPASHPENSALAQLWARTRIDELMAEDWNGAQQGNPKPEVREKVTQLGLDYRLMTQFTSFVAVEETTVIEGGKPRTIQVPVEMPEGVNPDTVFGTGTSGEVMVQTQAMAAKSINRVQNGGMGGAARGYAGSVIDGVHASAPASTEVVSVDGSPIVMEDTVRSGKRSGKDEAKNDRKERELRGQLESKMHPSVLAVYDCWKKAGRGAKCSGLDQGRVNIEVWLNAATPEVLGKLKALGFTISPGGAIQSSLQNADQNGIRLRGTLPVEKLESLAAMPEVKLVSLQRVVLVK